jgi:hypothetical protein
MEKWNLSNLDNYQYIYIEIRYGSIHQLKRKHAAFFDTVRPDAPIMSVIGS